MVVACRWPMDDDATANELAVALAMRGHRLQLSPAPIGPCVDLGPAAVAILRVGWPCLERGVQSVADRSPNMWTLGGLGVAVVLTTQHQFELFRTGILSNPAGIVFIGANLGAALKEHKRCLNTV